MFFKYCSDNLNLKEKATITKGHFLFWLRVNYDCDDL